MFKYDKRMATRIKVNITGDINDYASSFLAIYNNVKSAHELLKMYNDYDNGVYVVCENDIVNETKVFLSQFGEIAQCETVYIITPIADKIDYPNDYDIEFLDVEE